MRTKIFHWVDPMLIKLINKEEENSKQLFTHYDILFYVKDTFFSWLVVNMAQFHFSFEVIASDLRK